MNKKSKLLIASIALIALNVLVIPVVLFLVLGTDSFNPFDLLVGIVLIAASNFPLVSLFMAARRNDDKYVTWSLFPVSLVIAAYSIFLQIGAALISAVILVIGIVLAILLLGKLRNA